MPVTPLKPIDPYRYTTPGYPSPPGPGLINPVKPMAAPPSVGLLNNIPMPPPPAPYRTTPATARDAASVGYTPEGFTVDTNQTVAGQVRQIVDADSPLMQQAMTRANQKANARGMINSSMAIGAGQAAVLDAALPIAQQDASTYAAAHTNTQNAQNAALNFDAAGKNQASQVNAQLGTNVSLANAEAANKALQDSFQVNANYGLAALDVNTKMALANLDTQTKFALTQMENDNRQSLQANQDASSMFNQVATAIANISANPQLGEQAKKDGIATQMGLLKEGLRQQGDVAGLNLGGYFDYSMGGPQKAASPAEMAKDRQQLNFAIERAQADLPVWGVYPEPNADKFNAIYIEKNKALTDAKRALYEYNIVNKPAAPKAPVPPAGRPAPPPATGARPTGTVVTPARPSTPSSWRPGMPAPPGYKVNKGGRGESLYRA